MEHSAHTAVVTGGGGGIGRAIALALAQEGAAVAVADVDAAAAEDTARRITDFGRPGRGRSHRCDGQEKRRRHG